MKGTPFDFFGFKNGEPYIIELKCSLKYFYTPRETQKKRMQELLNNELGDIVDPGYITSMTI